MIFSEAKNDLIQHSSSEDFLVENINFGDVNETDFGNEPATFLDSQISPLRRTAQLNRNTNYEFFFAEVEPSLKYFVELPRNTNEALRNVNWRDAMRQQYILLIENHVWELVPLPENAKAIGSK